MDSESLASVPRGFYFNPTDDDICYYLKEWVNFRKLHIPIDVVDVNNFEPWDLQGKSTLHTRDRECYIFSRPSKKYLKSKSRRNNRTTRKGYWKSRGKDHHIPNPNGSRRVMIRKDFTFYEHGSRHTNWMMYEYHLAEEESEENRVSQDSDVLCKIFENHRGKGRENKEASFGKKDATATEKVAVGDGENGIFHESWSSPNRYLSGTSELLYDQNLNYIPEEYEVGANLSRVHDEFYDEDQDTLLHTQVGTADLDMADKFVHYDLLGSINFDDLESSVPSGFFGTENSSSHQTPITQRNEIGEAVHVSKESLRNDASFSKHNPKALTKESDLDAGRENEDDGPFTSFDG